MSVSQATLIFVLLMWLNLSRYVYSSGLPLKELERLLSLSQDESVPLVESSTSSTASHQPLNLEVLDGDWADIVRQHGWNDQPSAAAEHPIAPSAPSLQPDAAAAAVPLHTFQFTTQQRYQMIISVRNQFYSVLSVGFPVQGEIFEREYQGSLYQSLFDIIVKKLANVDRKFGMFPLHIGSDRYLLEQAKATKHDFRLLNGFTREKNHHIWYNVYRETSLEGSKGIYHFIGTFRGPHSGVNTEFRDANLVPTAVRLSQIQALSGSSFEAQVQPWT